MTPSRLRLVVRSAVAGLFLVLVGGGATAFADTPSRWEDAPSESPLAYLLVLFLIPAGLFVLIFVLTMLPSMVKKSGSEVVSAPKNDLTA